MPLRRRAATLTAVAATALLALAAPAGGATAPPAGRYGTVGATTPAATVRALTGQHCAATAACASAIGEVAPSAAAPASASAPAKDKKKDDASSTSTWLIVAVFFVASVGVGFLLSGRKRRRRD